MSEDLSKKVPEDIKEMVIPDSSNDEECERLQSTSKSNVPINTNGRPPINAANNTTESERMEKVLAQVIEQEFRGPIPSPDIIAGYENVVSGSANRIIIMAEQQSAHRQALELMQMKAEIRDSLLGVIFAFLLGIGCLVACIITVAFVPVAAGAICGSILGVTGIGSIVTAFLKNTRRSDK